MKNFRQFIDKLKKKQTKIKQKFKNQQRNKSILLKGFLMHWRYKTIQIKQTNKQKEKKKKEGIP